MDSNSPFGSALLSKFACNASHAWPWQKLHVSFLPLCTHYWYTRRWRIRRPPILRFSCIVQTLHNATHRQGQNPRKTTGTMEHQGAPRLPSGEPWGLQPAAGCRPCRACLLLFSFLLSTSWCPPGTFPTYRFLPVHQQSLGMYAWTIPEAPRNQCLCVASF